MLRKSLFCHGNTPCPTIDCLQVTLEYFPHDNITLCYQLTGDLSRIRIPEPQPASPKEGLWNHTCFELFIAPENATAYYEFNFSPSGQWAAFAFSDYRQRIPWPIKHPPVSTLLKTENGLTLTSRIPAPDLLAEGGSPRFLLGLTAVIESINGELSYWALHHPSGRPDFHDPAGFVCRL